MNKCPWQDKLCLFKKVESEGEGRVARSKKVKKENLAISSFKKGQILNNEKKAK
jgi:hypothetical protein